MIKAGMPRRVLVVHVHEMSCAHAIDNWLQAGRRREFREVLELVVHRAGHVPLAEDRGTSVLVGRWRLATDDHVGLNRGWFFGCFHVGCVTASQNEPAREDQNE